MTNRSRFADFVAFVIVIYSSLLSSDNSDGSPAPYFFFIRFAWASLYRFLSNIEIQKKCPLK